MKKIVAFGSVAVILFVIVPPFYFLVSPPRQPAPSLSNKRPVIGVLLQKDGKHGTYVVYSNYVKALEGSGAKVVPVWINEDTRYYQGIISSINGLVFPGGSADLLDPTDIGAAGQILFDLAAKLNDEGVHFPILGVCQGFQLLATASARQKILVSCNGTIKDNLPVKFIEDPHQSYLFRSAPHQVVEILTNEAITPNIHGLCVTRGNLNRLGLSTTWKVLSIDFTKNGSEYVTSMEHTRYPFAGVQFHPEKSMYDLSENSRYVSNYTAVFANRWFYDWLVMEARMNSNAFPDRPVNDRIIDRFCPVLITNKYGTVSNYYFNSTVNPVDELDELVSVRELKDESE
uniref:folate gamma-glutamyl hydrolase n=1 Tax=Lygus hesperus TaxID=30085 RepID=A0A146L944_LYGHE